MDDMERAALEKEYEEKSALLSEMMEKLPEMQDNFQKLEAARLARIIKDAENASNAEIAETERAMIRCQQVQREYEAAMESGDEVRTAACKRRYEDERRHYDAVEAHMRETYQRYKQELQRKHFTNEHAYQAALLTKAEQKQLEKEVDTFRDEYNALLKRCQKLAELIDA